MVILNSVWTREVYATDGSDDIVLYYDYQLNESLVY